MSDKTATEKALSKFNDVRCKFVTVLDAVACIDALHTIAVEQASEIRMLKLRVSELADEQPATVAPDADLHPVALKLAEAYRLALQDDDIDAGTRRDIRLAWSDITGVGMLTTNDAIVRYGLPS